MNCDEWLDATHEKVFQVVKESFGGAQWASILPEGTRTIVVWHTDRGGVVVVLSCSPTIALHKVDVLLTPTQTGPSKSEIYAQIDAAFRKQI